MPGPLETPAQPGKPGLRGLLSRSEWFLVAGIALLLLSSILPGLWAWRRHQRLIMTRTDIAVLVESAQRFHREYGSWPGCLGDHPADLRFGRDRSNAAVMNALRAVEGLGNNGHAGNEQQLVFIEVEPYRHAWSGLDESGAFLDAWGTPYQMAFDSNFDNACAIENSIYGRLIGQVIAIWSCGPDRRSDTADDILSWSTP